jgi:hypothetical protein
MLGLDNSLLIGNYYLTFDEEFFMNEYTDNYRGVQKVDGMKVFESEVEAKVAGKKVKFNFHVPVSPVGNKHKNRLQYLTIFLNILEVVAPQLKPKKKDALEKQLDEAYAKIDALEDEKAGYEDAKADFEKQEPLLLEKIDKLADEKNTLLRALSIAGTEIDMEPEIMVPSGTEVNIPE